MKNRKELVVVNDTETSKRLLELKEPANAVETLRQRLASHGHNKGRTADAFFREFFAKNNIRRD